MSNSSGSLKALGPMEEFVTRCALLGVGTFRVESTEQEHELMQAAYEAVSEQNKPKLRQLLGCREEDPMSGASAPDSKLGLGWFSEKAANQQGSWMCRTTIGPAEVEVTAVTEASDSCPYDANEYPDVVRVGLISRNTMRPGRTICESS